MAARVHIIILPGRATNGSWETFNVLFWFDITDSTSQLAQTSGSKWANATAADNSAIQSGAVLEEAQTFTFPAGLAKLNAAAVEAYLDQAWANRNGEWNGVGPGEYQNITESPAKVWG